jgi:flagellar biosynthesis/type III secretory pathway protein FliH
VRTLLVYLFEVARGKMNYAKLENLIEAAEPEVKERVMSIADELIEKGEQRGIEKGIERGIERGIEQGLQQGIEQGIEKGALIGQIQAYQKIVKEPVADAGQLRDKTLAELNEQVARLEEALQHRSS